MGQNSTTTSQRKKASQLGMPLGTAAARLRKSILFDFVKRLGLDSCFRCGKTILSSDDMSIDHKIPWLDGHIDLFWSLENIAFSHRSCNTSDGRRGLNKKLGPIGTAWCAKHKQFLPISNFDTNRNKILGVARYCKDCRREYRRLWSARKRGAGGADRTLLT